MKKFTKIVVALLVLATFAGIFAAMPAMAAADYSAIKLKTAQLTIGHYGNTSLTGDIIQHCAAPNYKEEAACLVDNDNGSAFWSKPYKFNALKDNGGSTVPVVLIDVANGGEAVTVAGFEMMLRSAFDCQILHFELQATTTAGSDNWTKVLEKRLSVNDWNSRKLRFEFEEITVYKFRLLVYDIAEADIAKDSYKEYTVCLGDETRFTLAEIDLLQKKESSGSTGGTTRPTQSTTPATTRPAFQFPVGNTTAPTTPAATTKPTTVATAKPTTPAATTKPTTVATAKPTTPVATAKPTTPVATAKPTTPVATAKPTTVATAKPTTPVATAAPSTPVETAPVTDVTTLVTTPTETQPIDATVDPSAPTDVTVDPSAPTDETVDPSAPVDPIVDPEYLTYEIVEEGAVITGCDAATGVIDGIVTIPETLGGYPVTAIGDAVFEGVELTGVAFAGTEEQWNQITVGTGNDVLASAAVTYQGTVVEPTEPTTEPEVTEPEATEPEVTEPEVTEPVVDEPADDEAGETENNSTTIIIIAIAGVAVLAGVLLFFILRKKKTA